MQERLSPLYQSSLHARPDESRGMLEAEPCTEHSNTALRMRDLLGVGLGNHLGELLPPCFSLASLGNDAAPPHHLSWLHTAGCLPAAA